MAGLGPATHVFSSACDKVVGGRPSPGMTLFGAFVSTQGEDALRHEGCIRNIENFTMKQAPNRVSVDLSTFPDLAVIYLGMRAANWRGIPTLLRTGRNLSALLRTKPDGLLAHESMMFNPRHLGFRQYWRDWDSLERFASGEPHRTWWTEFLRDRRGTGFWHETYTAARGIEAIYIDMPPIGLAGFAQPLTPQGPFMSARGRLPASAAPAHQPP
jgi:hypothetical protein